MYNEEGTCLEEKEHLLDSSPFTSLWFPSPGEVKKTLEENRNWEIRFTQDDVCESWLEDITSLICHTRGLFALFPYSSHAGRIARLSHGVSLLMKQFLKLRVYLWLSVLFFPSPWAMHWIYLGITEVINVQMNTAEQWALKVPGFVAALKPRIWVSWHRVRRRCGAARAFLHPRRCIQSRLLSAAAFQLLTSTCRQLSLLCLQSSVLVTWIKSTFCPM